MHGYQHAWVSYDFPCRCLFWRQVAWSTNKIDMRCEEASVNSLRVLWRIAALAVRNIDLDDWTGGWFMRKIFSSMEVFFTSWIHAIFKSIEKYVLVNKHLWWWWTEKNLNLVVAFRWKRKLCASKQWERGLAFSGCKRLGYDSIFKSNSIFVDFPCTWTHRLTLQIKGILPLHHSHSPFK